MNLFKKIFSMLLCTTISTIIILPSSNLASYHQNLEWYRQQENAARQTVSNLVATTSESDKLWHIQIADNATLKRLEAEFLWEQEQEKIEAEQSKTLTCLTAWHRQNHREQQRNLIRDIAQRTQHYFDHISAQNPPNIDEINAIKNHIEGIQCKLALINMEIQNTYKALGQKNSHLTESPQTK